MPFKENSLQEKGEPCPPMAPGFQSPVAPGFQSVRVFALDSALLPVKFLDGSE